LFVCMLKGFVLFRGGSVDLPASNRAQGNLGQQVTNIFLTVTGITCFSSLACRKTWPYFAPHVSVDRCDKNKDLVQHGNHDGEFDHSLAALYLGKPMLWMERST
jgi:hypothetical protein